MDSDSKVESPEGTRTWLITVSFLIEVPESELKPKPYTGTYPNTLMGEVGEKLRVSGESVLQGFFGELPDHLGWSGEHGEVIDGEDLNSGRCVECGRWTTDAEKPSTISGLKTGATVDGRMLCADHLPGGHRWAWWD